MDPRLVEQARSGDREAYARLAAESSHRLYAIALRIVRDVEAASDVLQETLVDIWRDLPTLRDVARFEAWSYAIVVNRCRAHHRRFHRAVVEVDLFPTDDPVSDSQLSVAMRDELERGFRALTADQRAVLVLYYYRDLGIEEIGRALGLPPGTVKSRLHAAREAMRAALEAQGRVSVGEGRTA